MRSSHLNVSRAVALALAVSSSSSLWAQGAEELTLEEIVVTAQKRSENLQETPIKVTALSQDELLRSGVKDFSTLNKVAPEVSVNPQNNGTVVAIRGVRSNSFGPAQDSAVALHIDGAYLARFQGINGLFFDLQNLEVADGPQGTLYGRNATAGTMNMISKKPGKEFGGYGVVEGGNYNLVAAEAALNLPIADNFAVRVAGRHYKHDGYFTDTGLDDANQNSGRLSLRLNITDSQTLNVSGSITKQTGKNISGNIVAEGPDRFAYTQQNGTTVAAGTGAANPPSADGSKYVTSPTVIVPNDPRHNALLAGNADRNFVDTTLKAIVGQYDLNLNHALLTVQGSYFDLLNLYGSGNTNTALELEPFRIPTSFGDQVDNWKSVEVRLTSTDTEKLKWVGGLYWFKEDLSQADFGAYAVNPGGVPVPPGTAPGAFPPNPFTQANPTVQNNIENDFAKAEAYAAFAQATWKATDKFAFTGGIRYNYDKKSARIVTHAFNNVLPQNPTAANPFTGSNDWTKVTYKLTAEYDLTENNHTYASYSTAYKAGGFAFGTHPEYQPQNMKAFEVGSKNEFLNRRLRINGAAWYYKYTDYETTVLLCIDESVAQCPVSPSAPFNPGTQAAIGVINAGAASIYGASIDLQALLFTADKLDVSVQWLDGKYKDFDLTKIPYVAPIVRFDYSGTRLGFAADWTATGSYTHVFDLGNSNLDARLGVQYATERLLANQGLPGSNTNIMSDPATVLDFSLRYAPKGNAWEVTAYCNNLTDELIKTAAQRQSINSLTPNGPGGPPPVPGVNSTATYFTANYAPPRTFGVIFKAKFGGE